MKTKPNSKVYFKTVLIFIIILVQLTLLPSLAFSEEESSSRDQIARNVARTWMQVGEKQFERGQYRQAEQSYLNATDYSRFLSEQDRQKLNRLLEKAHNVAAEKKTVLKDIDLAKELADKGELEMARARFNKVNDSRLLAKSEQDEIANTLKSIDARLAKEDSQISDLCRQSLESYRSGDFEKARQGFSRLEKMLAKKANPTFTKTKVVEVEMTIEPEEFIANHQAQQEPIEAEQVVELQDIIEPEQFVEIAAEPEVSLIDVAETEPIAKYVEEENEVIEQVEISEPEDAVVEAAKDEQGDDYDSAVNKKRSLLRSYTAAVVDDAVTKSNKYISEKQFRQAAETLQAAGRVVSKNRLFLGGELYRQHSEKLNQLSEKIPQGE